LKVCFLTRVGISLVRP